MRDLIQKLQLSHHLTRGEMHEAMTEIMNGRMNSDEMKEFLLLLNHKGFTVEEITGAAQIMRRFAIGLETGDPLVFDVVGTGGDAKHTFNISTATALVTAAAGVRVAKHGNRSVSSRCGSADVLEALGVNISLPHERLGECLRQVGIVFLFAQAHHPAMKHAAPVRRELGVKTIFNVLGPLTNPARATHQMMGVYSKHLAEQMVHVLKNLGSKRVTVVHGMDGLDEISTAAATFVSELVSGEAKSCEITPEEFGLPRCREEDLKGGDARENAFILSEILAGQKGPRRDAVLLNSAYALYTAEKSSSPAQGLELAAQLIDSGRAAAKLAELREFTNRGA